MTQADNAVVALRRSLDSKPIPGPGSVTIKTPLPDGWASFCSKPDDKHGPHWYAVPPYNVQDLKDEHGPASNGLEATVSAMTWHGLHQVVAAQINLYESLTQGQG